MKTLLIILLIAFVTVIIAQDSKRMEAKNQQKIEKNDKENSNKIDFNNPAQKIKPVKVTNHERAEVGQNRKMGLSSTSGPVETLEKKQNVESDLTNKDLQKHLRSNKTMRPMRN